jgi:hypothetical protein
MAGLLSRRTWLQLVATAPALGQNVFDHRPALNARLNALWNQAHGTPETASIVSSIGYASLPPLRGWRDERFLHAYIAWANRPEAARFEGDALTADLGPYDWILFRRTSNSVTSDTVGAMDPIGYTLFQLNPGVHRIHIQFPPIMHEQRKLPLNGIDDKPLPTIEAITAAGSDVVTLYGSGFEGSQFDIASEAGPGTILYSVHNQINARVPSLDRIRLTIDGSSTPWVAVTRLAVTKP